MVASAEELTEGDRSALRAEGAILADVRDTALLEYSRLSVREKKFRIARDIGYLMAVGQASTGGFMGALGGILAITNRKPKIAGMAGLGFILSGSCITTAPIAARAGSILAGKLEQRRLRKDLPGLDQVASEKFDVDRAQLASLLSSSAADGYVLRTLRARAPVYELQNNVLDKHVTVTKAEVAQANRDFFERLIVAAGIGGTKMGWGIQLANAGWGFNQRPPVPVIRVPVNIGGTVTRVPLPPPKGAANLFAKRVAQGATTFIPGTALGILDTAQLRMRGELRWHELKKRGVLPGQILKERLESLDNIEKILAPLPEARGEAL